MTKPMVTRSLVPLSSLQTDFDATDAYKKGVHVVCAAGNDGDGDRVNTHGKLGRVDGRYIHWVAPRGKDSSTATQQQQQLASTEK